MRLGAFDDHQLRSCRAMGDFEALATSCRDAAFRESLAATDVWSVATAALNDCLRILKANVVSSVANSVSQTDSSESGVADQDDDDDGLGYTLRVSKGQLPDVNSAEDIAARAVTVCDREAVEVAVETATSVLRFLRNASAGVRANQDACRISNCFSLTHDIIIGCCEWIDVDDDAISSAVVLLQQVALQFSVNFVTGNSANQAAAWNAYFPDHFQKILVECQEHRKVCAFTAALIMNCINSTDDTENKTITFVNAGEEEPASSGQRRTDLVCARNLVTTLLQRCMPKPVAYNSSTSGLQGDVDTPDAEDPTFEWICLLFRVLFRAGHARDLYNAVGAHMLSRLWSRVTPEQLILLRMLSVWVDHVASSLRTIDHAHHDDPEVLALVSTVDFVKATWVYIISTDEEDRPDDVEPVRKLMWIDLENEAKLLLLEVLGEITVSCRQELTLSYEDTSKELLRSVLTELRRVWQLRPNNPKPNSTSKPSSTQTPIVVSEDSGEKEPEGYRSRLIRVAGNLCFRDTARQDLVREEEFIPLLLAHCNVDDQNPLIREWALVALRNLCEGNEANQRYIDAMRPQSRETDNSAAKTED